MGIMNIATTNGVCQMKNIDAHIRSNNCRVAVVCAATMGSDLRLVANCRSKFPGTVNSWEISHTAQRGAKARV